MPWPSKRSASLAGANAACRSIHVARSPCIVTSRVADAEDDGHRRIARRASGEKAIAAAAKRELLDQLDDRARPHRRLRMSPDERAAEVVDRIQVDVHFAREQHV